MRFSQAILSIATAATFFGTAVFAQEAADAAPAQEQVLQQAEAPVSPSHNIDVKVTFPDSELFGVKLVNGKKTTAALSVTNNEVEPITLAFIGGALIKSNPLDETQSPVVVRNLTSTRYSLTIPAGTAETVTYGFSLEMQPQKLRLTLATVFVSPAGKPLSLTAYNEEVTIVEPPTSLLDPQILFLYLMLLGLFAGSSYYIYNKYIITMFPQMAGGGKGGDRAKRSSGGSKRVDPSKQVAVVGGDGPAVTSGAKAYDQSWIPAQHLNRPEVRRVKSGSNKQSKPKATRESPAVPPTI